MNQPIPSQSSRIAFEEAVRNYVRPLPEKFQTLLPYRDGIAELRSKQASFRTVAQLLKQVGVSVSHDTIARFCHAVIEPPPRRKRNRLVIDASATESNPEHSSASVPNIVRRDDRMNVSTLLQQQRASNESISPSIKKPQSGPRIADPKNV